MSGFSRIVIIGVGLIGASVGLAAKKNRLASCVVGIGRRRENLEIALRRNAIDQASCDVEEGLRMMGDGGK